MQAIVPVVSAAPIRTALQSLFAAALFSIITMTSAQAGVPLTTTLKIFKDVSGGDPMTGVLFNVAVNCTGIPFSANVDVPSGTYAEVFNVPAPNNCTATENPALPAPPPGYIWEASTTPPGPISFAVVGGVEPNVFIFNRLVQGGGDPPGSILVTKAVVGGPAPGGNFMVDINCTTTPFSTSVNVVAGGSAAVNNVPAPNTCTVTENAALPAAPAGFAWDAASTPPAPIQVSVQPQGTVTAAITNTLIEPPPGGGGFTPPAVLPTLGQYGMILLGLLLAMAAAFPLLRRD